MSIQTVAARRDTAAARLGRAARSRSLMIIVSVAAVIGLAFSATASAHSARSGGAHEHHRAHPSRSALQHRAAVVQHHRPNSHGCGVSRARHPKPHLVGELARCGACARASSMTLAYKIAAFAQALHDTLAAQVPSQRAAARRRPRIDARRGESGTGTAKSDGIAVGKTRRPPTVLRSAAATALTRHAVDIPFTPPPPAGPGVWQPTPPAFAPAIPCRRG